MLNTPNPTMDIQTISKSIPTVFYSWFCLVQVSRQPDPEPARVRDDRSEPKVGLTLVHFIASSLSMNIYWFLLNFSMGATRYDVYYANGPQGYQPSPNYYYP